MTSKLEAFAKKNKIKYFLINFTDLNGAQRSKLVPSSAIAEMESEGAGFAGFATYLDMTPAYPDMFSIPDPDSVIQLPWKPEVAWVAGDLFMDGNYVEQAPRVILKKIVNQAKKLGYVMKAGVEPEYMLISQDGQTISDEKDIASKPCYDQQALMRRYDVISEICDHMLSLGWGTYQNDHEDANGQFEMNWDYDDCLVTADRHVFFKFMVKTLAEKHGLRATFMPKPFSNLTGNGCHAHISVWDLAGKKNIFENKKADLGLSDNGIHFLGGLMKNAKSLVAITNPTVNSYKRINAPITQSGATWAPNTITWSGNNRTHMVRIPGPGRFELRLPDGATNPYLLQAVIIGAGIIGIEKKLNPGKRYDNDIYTDKITENKVEKLPLNLIDAIREFSKNSELKNKLGSEFSKAFIKLKNEEWDKFNNHLSSWEIDNTMDI